jgi:soluble lytic murein transglycosylase-like protein
VRRPPVVALSCLASGILSCAILSGERGALPPVSAAGPIAQVEERPPTLSVRDPRVVEVEELLLTRATGLAYFELVRLAYTIVRESDRHRLDPQLVLAMMEVESNFDNFAVSSAGALGLMQVMPATGAELAERMGVPWRGPQTLFDPIANVRFGVAYLRELSDRYGYLFAALAAYNWGPGHIDRRLAVGTPLPVRYPLLVLRTYDQARDSGTRS